MYDLILYIFLFFVAINIFYWVYFFRLPKIKKQPSGTPDAVSIIICAFNEIENLRNFLPKFLDQKNIEFEIILVNDRSSDGTKEFLSEIKDQKLTVINIDHTPDEWNSKKWALKQGVQLAKFKNILFTDADCYPTSSNWARIFSSELKNSDVVLGYSPYQKEKSFINDFIQFETSMTAFSYLGFANKGIPYMAVGRNFACKKSLHTKFNFKNVEHLQGGDDDLFINQLPPATKIKSVNSKESQVISIPKKSIKEYLTQKKRHLNVSGKYSLKNKLLIGIYNLSSIMFYLGSIFILINSSYNTVVLSAILFRTSIIFCIFGVNCLRTGNPTSLLKNIVLDFFYTIFLWTWGPFSIIAKKVRWR